MHPRHAVRHRFALIGLPLQKQRSPRAPRCAPFTTAAWTPFAANGQTTTIGRITTDAKTQPHDKMPNTLLLVRAIRRGVPPLRRDLRWLLPFVAGLLALQAALATLWLRQPPEAVLRAGLAALPGLILLGLVLLNLRGVAARVAGLVLLFCANYAQYAFASYFRRFLGTGELHLAAANPAHELVASVALYFSGTALLAALATTALLAVAVFRRPAAEASRLRAAAAFVALLAWALLVDDVSVRRPRCRSAADTTRR